MTNELSNLQQQIQEALQLLQESELLDLNKQGEASQQLPTSDNLFAEPTSLFEKCNQVCAQYQQKKPTIRIIHHVACSGGTLISKCLSVMPNVYLLSEAHPFTDLHIGNGKPQFMPTDISSLSRYANIPNTKDLMGTLFLLNIVNTEKHVSSYGGTLLIRDHTHSDFHVGTSSAERPSVVSTLSSQFNIKSVLTFRDPIDSYLSLRLNKWVHFTPGTFDEYCIRILNMLNIYKDVQIFHYEDFVNSPTNIMKQICTELEIQYNENWEYYFDTAQVTGDSGRSSSTIEARPRRDLSSEMQDIIANSEAYIKIRKLLY